MHLLLGPIVIAVGTLMVIKSESLLSVFGRVRFFEDKLGTGGSRLGYKLLGVLVIFIGILILTDLFGGFMGWVLSPLTRHQ